jgi:vacuolar iron transporter family protein
VSTKVLIFAGFAGLVAGTLLALVLTGWISAQISDVRPLRPIVRTAAIGALSMAVTYAAGRLFHP